MIEDLKMKLKALSQPAVVNHSTTNSEDIRTIATGDNLDDSVNKSDSRESEESSLDGSFINKVNYKPYRTSSPIQKTNHGGFGSRQANKVEPKVIELVPGYGVTCTQRQIDEVQANGKKSPTKMIRLLLNVFFTEEDLASSSCYGNGTKSSKRLDEDIIAACIKYVSDHFKHVSKPVLVTAINDKCAQTRVKREGRKYGLKGQ